MTVLASIDIETLSTRGNAVVLSIGICFFDDEKWQPFDDIVKNGIELFFCQETQKTDGRHVMASTIEWWEQQGDKAQRCLNPESPIHPREFYQYFEAFCERSGQNINWVTRNAKWVCRGPQFDVAIMESLFFDYNVSPPWKYYKVRDIRTWLECHGLEDNLKLKKPANMVAHNALHDAAFDAYMMLEVLHKPVDQLELDMKER